jgi:hypothetical protein
LHLAGATGRLQSIDFSFNLTEKYTFWSGMIGGLFLMLSYFGCDQSQVQRYLTAKSIDEARQSLMMSAYVKIPLQLLILVSGVLVFVFYVFYTPPMLFNRVYDAQVASGPQAAQYVALQQEFDAEIAVRRTAAERNDRDLFLASDARLRGIRAKAVGLVKEATGDVSYNDVNYVFSTFITTQLPIGLVGLMIAAIFAAATSALAKDAEPRSCETRFGGQVVCGDLVIGITLEQYEAGLKKRADEIRAEEAIEFCEDIRKAKKLSSMQGIEDVSKPRREVLPYGAMVLERLLKRLEPSEVRFSVFGIREGLVYSLMSDNERRKDPLLSFCAEFAQQRSRDAEHALELCDWTDALFDGPGPKETDEERRLRHAACLLSDTGWRAHPDYRGEQSLILIAHAALGGIDHPGRVFLALANYFRHMGTSGNPEDDGKDKLSERLKSIVSKKLYKRTRIIGAAIRAAHMLSIGHPGIIDETPLSYERNKLVLTIPKAYAALDGERLRRRFAALSELLEREPDIRVKH